MRIAILGTRGIPARYGGFETFAEELSTRLVARGHHVTVYCRERHPEPTYRGVSLVYLPTWRHKYFDTIVHTFLSTLHLIFHRVDVALYCNAANAIFTFWPRLFGIPVALNVDGLERKRKKWNRLGQGLVFDFRAAGDLLPQRGRSPTRARSRSIISSATGSAPSSSPMARRRESSRPRRFSEQLGLERGRYFLYVSRMEPENNALLVREAFEKIDTPLKLALIGDAPYAQEYIQRVRDTTRPAHRDAGRDLRTRAITNCCRTVSPTFMPPKLAARTRR